jgi:GTP-binding protein
LIRPAKLAPKVKCTRLTFSPNRVRYAAMRDPGFFFDEAKIFVRAGNGGNGCTSFRREKFVPLGGPDGGHGGKGGDVVLMVDPHVNTLLALRKHPHWHAKHGTHGQGKHKHGKNGADAIVRVPRGTVVRDAETGEIIADLVRDDDRVIVARGGRGGRGNSAFVSSTNQAPHFAEKGETGEERTLVLELKLLADIGIIGLPNAGKSTLLAAVTAARPKIADYPFTTLVPNLGVAIVDDRDVVLADIPGLIEGAHAGAGLGDKFLRHIERTRVLIHLLDGTLADPLYAFDTINHELAAYNEHLATKPQIVAVNKMDLPEAQAQWDKIQKALARRKIETYAISAVTGQGVRDVLRAALKKLDETAPEPLSTIEELPIIRPREDEEAFEILREQHVFRLRGKKVERVVAMTNFDQEEAIQRLHRIFQAMGVTRALQNAGIHEGDVVRIGQVELEWQE